MFRLSQDWAGTSIQLPSWNSFAVSVKDNIPPAYDIIVSDQELELTKIEMKLLVFNERALGEIAIQGSERVGSVITIIISKNLLDFFGHIWGVICVPEGLV